MRRATAAAVALSLVPTSARSLDVKISFRGGSSASTRSTRPSMGRPTHFIALPLPDPQLHDAVKRVQTAIVAGEKRARGCEVPPCKSHLTVFVLDCSAKGAIERALGAFAACDSLVQPLPPPRIRLNGLGSFGSNVIYAAAEPSTALDRIAVLVDGVRRVFDEHGLAPPPAQASSWTPHLTLLKTSRVKSRVAKGRPPPKLPPTAYADVLAEDRDFGMHLIPRLELCAMSGQGEGGYYPVLASLSFDGTPPAGSA